MHQSKSELLRTAKPILFNTEMVMAILDGRKTQTRQIIKPKLEGGLFDYFRRENMLQEKTVVSNGIDSYSKEKIWHESRYKKGDILYVREAWKYIEGASGYGYSYMAGGGIHNDTYKWNPPASMPKEAARIFLRVTGVRAERVKNILDDDCVAEGLHGITHGISETHAHPIDFPIRNNFQILRDSLNAKLGYGWDTNLWVWVYKFERIEL